MTEATKEVGKLVRLYPYTENNRGEKVWSVREKKTEIARVVERSGGGFALYWVGRLCGVYHNHTFDTIEETIEWIEATLRKHRKSTKHPSAKTISLPGSKRLAPR